MADIIDMSQFKQKKPDMVWECANCGGQVYYILLDGMIECYKCSRKSTYPEVEQED